MQSVKLTLLPIFALVHKCPLLVLEFPCHIMQRGPKWLNRAPLNIALHYIANRRAGNIHYFTLGSLQANGCLGTEVQF